MPPAGFDEFGQIAVAWRQCGRQVACGVAMRTSKLRMLFEPARVALGEGGIVRPPGAGALGVDLDAGPAGQWDRMPRDVDRGGHVGKLFTVYSSDVAHLDQLTRHDPDSIGPMSRAIFAATVVEMDDGRLALLIELEPDPGFGPLVVDPVSDATASGDRATQPSKRSPAAKVGRRRRRSG